MISKYLGCGTPREEWTNILGINRGLKGSGAAQMYPLPDRMKSGTLHMQTPEIPIQIFTVVGCIPAVKDGRR